MSECPCPHCGGLINPGSLLGKGKKKTMTPAALAARRANSAKSRKKRTKPAGELA